MSTAPPSFLNVVIHDKSTDPTLCGLCAGYELGVWRVDALADHIIEWLPEFCLTEAELKTLHPGNAIAMVRKAAGFVFQTKKFERRGEFGEVILHAVMRQVYGTEPAISKIYYKSAINDTVKGFDAVHVVANGSDLELWLGEVKFYNSITKAISDVISELGAHLKADYLKNEFSLIVNKIDPAWAHADRLKKLLNSNTSLDEVFTRACIPVLLTYDSAALKAHSISDAKYLAAITQEFKAHWASFKGKLPASINIRLHLFLVPLNTKADLQKRLNEKLKTWQKL